MNVLIWLVAVIALNSEVFAGEAEDIQLLLEECALPWDEFRIVFFSEKDPFSIPEFRAVLNCLTKKNSKGGISSRFHDDEFDNVYNPEECAQMPLFKALKCLMVLS
ncbi:unnamed protein product [Tenebrio molitor]|nr:unnamed protein product [Tenebrio molitor]